MNTQAKQALRVVGTKGPGAAPSEASYRSSAERRSEGKTLRDSVPREKHSGWKPPKDRRDPVELVLENEGRLPELSDSPWPDVAVAIRLLSRNRCAMAADLAQTPSSGLGCRLAATPTC